MLERLRKLRLKYRAARIASSPLFHGSWYLHRYADVREAGIAPALHYVRTAGVEGRWPNPLFDPDWFARHAGSRGGHKTPLERYLDMPVAERPSTHPLIDPAWYRQRHSDRLSPDQDVLEHFLMHGATGKFSPHPEFDSAWYLARYPDVRESDVNPLCHYLEFGAAEGRNPNAYFDSEWYASRNLAVGDEDLNPLVHYLVRGKKAGLRPRPAPRKPMWWDSLAEIDRPQAVRDEAGCQQRGAVARLLAGAPNVTVIILVLQASNRDLRSLEKVIGTVPLTVRRLIFTPEQNRAQVESCLASFERSRNIELRSISDHCCIADIIKAGIPGVDNDDLAVISPGCVPVGGWLSRLRILAYREPAVGVVNATRYRPEPSGNFSESELGRAFSQAGAGRWHSTGHIDFACTYLRRDFLAAAADRRTAPAGNPDAAAHSGPAHSPWTAITDAATLVIDTGLQSHGRLSMRAFAGLPEQPAGSVLQSPEEHIRLIAQQLANIRNALAEHEQRPRRRVMFVIGALFERGGTTQTNYDLMQALQDEVETFLLRSDGSKVELFNVRGDCEYLLDHAVLDEPLAPFPHANGQYDDVVASWLREYAIEAIHVRHIAFHSLGLLEIAKAVHVPVLFSFHDYYAICPTVKLLDENNRFCSGHCTKTDGDCTAEFWHGGAIGHLKHHAVFPWKQQFSQRT